MKYIKIIPLILGCSILTACDMGSDNQASKSADAENAIAIGTDIKDVIKQKIDPDAKGIQELKWEDLVPEDFRPDRVVAKYQQEISDAPEGSEEERELFKKIMGELNSAGPNLSLDGKTVRIPGFVSPLDTNGELVGDFLLVPYFGSCIHSPPPPVNQTVMVSPGEGKSIELSKIRRPVWVVGELQADEITTDLATAGYQIKNAHLEAYIRPTQ